MVKIEQLIAGYTDVPILNGVSMEAHAGEITTVIGCNGCGKSTLLKALIGALPAHSGKIQIDGCVSMGQKELAKQIAYLPQSKNVPDITAGRYVLHGRFPYLSYPRVYTKEDVRIAKEVMEQLGISNLWDTLLAELSGGMRQKVYLAMALAKQAPVIIMDEPTTYLDISQQRLFAETVQALAKAGKTVILVLHDILLALKISDAICVMEDGRIKQTGAPAEILSSGILEKLYGIEIAAIETAEGARYYYK